MGICGGLRWFIGDRLDGPSRGFMKGRIGVREECLEGLKGIRQA